MERHVCGACENNRDMLNGKALETVARCALRT
jgi:hypothetical protein